MTADVAEALPIPGLRAEIAALLLQGVESGSLPFAVLALPERAAPPPAATEAAPRLRLPLLVEVPASSLPREPSAPPDGAPDAAAGAPDALAELAEPGALELYAYAVTAKGSVAAHLALRLATADRSLDAASAGLKLHAALDLPPGDYSLRLLLLDRSSRRLGLRVLDVELPPDGGARLAAPRIRERCDLWSHLVATPGEPTDAAARPVLRSGETLELEVLAPADLGDAPPPTLHYRPTSEGGEEGRSEVELLSREPGTDGIDRGLDRLRLRATVAELPRGVYELRLELGALPEALRSEPLEAWLVGPQDLPSAADAGCPASWSAVLAKAMASGGAPGLPTPAGTAAGTVPETGGHVRESYRAVLSELVSTGELAAAVARLGETEAALTDDGVATEAVGQAEIAVAAELAAADPEALLPLLALHQEAYLEHFHAGRYPLAGHSHRMILDLARLMTEHLDSPDGRRLAADVQTGLAEYATGKSMYFRAQELLEEALELDPGHRQALLLLATNYEHFGRYAEARELLLELSALDAADPEPRLRLATVAERTGRPREAERLLRALLREQQPPWMLSLAYQTLARVLIDGDRSEEAVEVLAAGRRRLPGDQRLQLLAAHAVDRAGRPREAAELLAALPIESAAGHSPRLRYALPPSGSLEPLRERLLAAVRVRIPRLARALGPTTEGAP